MPSLLIRSVGELPSGSRLRTPLPRQGAILLSYLRGGQPNPAPLSSELKLLSCLYGGEHRTYLALTCA